MTGAEKRDEHGTVAQRTDVILTAAEQLARDHYGRQADEIPLISVQIDAAMIHADSQDRIETGLEKISHNLLEQT